MMKSYWTATELCKLFRIVKTPNALYYDSEQGNIPAAQMRQRGAIAARMWGSKDLPLIGARYGFIDQSNFPRGKTRIIVVYIPKGGSLKTTFTYNLARILALHGIKTLCVGLETQKSLTTLLHPHVTIESVDEIMGLPGLYEVNFNNQSIDSVIRHTDISTLDFVPENAKLHDLEDLMNTIYLREDFLSRTLAPVMSQYQAIVIDTSSYFTWLVKSALRFATDVIFPVACNAQCYESLMDNLSMIDRYKKNIGSIWNIKYVRTLYNKDQKLSQDINTLYKELFSDQCCNTSLRVAAAGDKACAERQSIFEYDPTSDLATDYYHVIKEIYGR